MSHSFTFPPHEGAKVFNTYWVQPANEDMVPFTFFSNHSYPLQVFSLVLLCPQICLWDNTEKYSCLSHNLWLSHFTKSLPQYWLLQWKCSRWKLKSKRCLANRNNSPWIVFQKINIYWWRDNEVACDNLPVLFALRGFSSWKQDVFCFIPLLVPESPNSL